MNSFVEIAKWKSSLGASKAVTGFVNGECSQHTRSSARWLSCMRLWSALKEMNTVHLKHPGMRDPSKRHVFALFGNKLLSMDAAVLSLAHKAESSVRMRVVGSFT